MAVLFQAFAKGRAVLSYGSSVVEDDGNRVGLAFGGKVRLLCSVISFLCVSNY